MTIKRPRESSKSTLKSWIKPIADAQSLSTAPASPKDTPMTPTVAISERQSNSAPPSSPKSHHTSALEILNEAQVVTKSPSRPTVNSAPILEMISELELSPNATSPFDFAPSSVQALLTRLESASTSSPAAEVRSIQFPVIEEERESSDDDLHYVTPDALLGHAPKPKGKISLSLRRPSTRRFSNRTLSERATKRRAPRKFHDSHYDYGYKPAVGDDGKECPQCLACDFKLANESMVKGHLLKHRAGCSPDALDWDRHDWEDWVATEKPGVQTSLVDYGFPLTKDTEVATLVEVSMIIGKNRLAHVTGENAFKPAIEKVIRRLDPNSRALKFLDRISFSNYRVKRVIKCTSLCMQKQIMEELKSSPFPVHIQLDESTDSSSSAYLVLHVRYMVKEGDDYVVRDKLLFCDRLIKCKSWNIFNSINKHFVDSGMSWSKVASVCTDGAKVMTGKKTALAARLKRVNKDIVSKHCLLHCLNLATKDLSEYFEEVMKGVIEVIQAVRSSHDSHRQFGQYCKRHKLRISRLFLYSAIRWLSRGQCLNRFFQYRDHIYAFLIEQKNFDVARKLTDKKFMLHVAYLSDIFDLFNDTNTGLQFKDLSIDRAFREIDGLIQILQEWLKSSNNLSLERFRNANHYITLNQDAKVFLPDFFSKVSSHIDFSIVLLQAYTREHRKHYSEWMSSPFHIDLGSLTISEALKRDLRNLRKEVHLKNIFMECTKQEKNLSIFWAFARQKYPALSELAIRSLLSYATSYLSEQTFSGLASLKTKYRNKLNAIHDLNVLRNDLPTVDEVVEFMKTWKESSTNIRA